MHPSANADLELKASGRTRLLTAWHYPLTYDLSSSLSAYVQCLPVPEKVGREIPYPLFKQGFASLSLPVNTTAQQQ